MKVYIPFNMIVDTDFGIIRFYEKYKEIPEYPKNKLKAFLINRKEENPLLEYRELRKLDLSDITENNLYSLMIQNHYESILKLSNLTDLLALVINTHKLGLANEMEITIGCNSEEEINFFKSITSSLKYSIITKLNSSLKLNDFDYIFIKVLDKYYTEYLLNNNISGKRLYVANYRFNTLVDEERNETIIDPEIHMSLESEGDVISLISIYNKK